MIETICANCGNKKLFDDSITSMSFRCPSCGIQIEFHNADSSPGKMTVIARSVEAKNQRPESVGNYNQLSPPVNPFPDNKSKNGLIIGAILACGMILLAFLIYLFLNTSKQATDNGNEKKETVTDSVPSVETEGNENASDKRKAIQKPKKHNSEAEYSDDSRELNNDFSTVDIGMYKNIMKNYYYNLTNDNYEGLSYYYNDILDEYITKGQPISRTEVIEAHESYNNSHPFHIYELAGIKPYKNQNGRISFFVKLRVSIKKNYYDEYKPTIVNDIFTFNEYNKIVSVLINK